MRKSTLAAVAAGVLMALGLSAPASAAPMVPAAAVATDVAQSGVTPVHYRPYRHCHGPRWNRWCHGPHYNNYYSPGVSIYIGPRYKWRKHHRHHRFHHHRRHRH